LFQQDGEELVNKEQIRKLHLKTNKQHKNNLKKYLNRNQAINGKKNKILLKNKKNIE